MIKNIFFIILFPFGFSPISAKYIKNKNLKFDIINDIAKLSLDELEIEELCASESYSDLDSNPKFESNKRKLEKIRIGIGNILNSYKEKNVNKKKFLGKRPYCTIYNYNYINNLKKSLKKLVKSNQSLVFIKFIQKFDSFSINHK